MSQSIDALQGPIDAVFTDLDGTLSTDGRLEKETVIALFKLFSADIPVVLVTGRPAGWGHTLLNLFPFSAVVSENGGVIMFSSEHASQTLYGIAEHTLALAHEKLTLEVEHAMALVPAAKLSGDSAYRLVDIAIDWNEEASLSVPQAETMMRYLLEKGYSASRSSVHINVAPKGFDKFTACQRVVEELSLASIDSCVYIGDSLNDEAAFAGFLKSVGVSNVRKRWEELKNKPRYITDAAEGAGFCEFAKHLLTL